VGPEARWLIALDIDGTILHPEGTISDEVTEEVQRVAGMGHEVTLATGRASASTLPLLDRLGITPEFLVCSNGAMTLRRDPSAPFAYRRYHVESFDPEPVLLTVQSHLPAGSYAVEDRTGFYRYTDAFPNTLTELQSAQVEFSELLKYPAARLVVVSPDHELEDFLEVVDRMGLRRVNYFIGWTAWLDIAPEGVNKATGLERVRSYLDIPPSRVLVVGDGRNDIDMLRWAAEEGRSVAMGQAPQEVRAAAREVTGSVNNDGVVTVLSAFQ
jgi:5-amino-6-(5-phospho-D-ribitylamino)uracil phosphatase